MKNLKDTYIFIYVICLKAPTRCPQTGRILWQGASAVVCRSFTNSNVETKGFRYQNGTQQVSKTMKNETQKGTKRSKRTLYDTLSEQGRTSIEKGCRKGLRGAGFGKPFEDPNPEKNTKNTSQKTCKNQSWENIKNDDKTMPKRNQKS